MFCQKCGAKLKETAKFCGGCGTKVERAVPDSENKVLTSVALAELPEGLSIETAPVEILEVRAEGPDDDRNLSITVKCRCTNNSSQDWNLLKVRTQLLNAFGQVIDETTDRYEELIEADSQFEFEPSFWGVGAGLLGSEPEKVHVVVHLTASLKFSFDLGNVLMPETAFSTVNVPTINLDAIQLVSCCLWKSAPDDDKDSRVELRALLQNLNNSSLPLVKIMAHVSDKHGEEIAELEGEDELRAGELIVINTSSYAKDKKLFGATALLQIDLYLQFAVGLIQHRVMNFSEININNKGSKLMKTEIFIENSGKSNDDNIDNDEVESNRVIPDSSEVDSESVEYRLSTLMMWLNDDTWFPDGESGQFTLPDGSEITATQECIEDVMLFLENYDEMTFHRIKEFDEIEFSETNDISELLDNEGNFLHFIYDFDLSSVARATATLNKYGSVGKHIVVRILQFGEGNEVGCRIDIASDIDRDWLNSWISTIQDEGWKVES